MGASLSLTKENRMEAWRKREKMLEVIGEMPNKLK